MEEIRVKHILQKHTLSRNPHDSYRDKPITRSKEEAIENIEKIRDAIINDGKSFADIASEISECRSAANGGDLGFFGRGMMQKEFEDAAFALSVGEISGLVDSDSGIHIILREE
ncbi:unnamed protein product [Moneuplotes crassus]|uniref:Peptidyl-prolyl cis-trans isomerase n=1 Tax=Euplotes crassus TaxID=5936 RepID=A0A7S3NYX0_EUPCR|nr:unnamed protein product [Moneuplotes crassus]|eukprot:CAMPEP_0197005554 /NCGR_PEP_ID=MMETSP1380-20130617/29894_1 /TAXON_ID=5936 /ORGANISM="Euplotes crassus, Strain CT5" /LENGTH=113 /DNA_ID=CAMNT_0042424725 /DNA_START=6 /DNA_END=347 /DNA_ORIENTATION=+